jgi:pumilio RNA-binding family
MATQGAVRLIGGAGAGGWSSKGFGAFDSSLGNLPGGEGLGFVDSGSGIYGGWRESVPDRSGSAPPSMEGSLAALGNLIGQKSGNFDASLGDLDNVTGSSTAEEQLRADPAYFDYYGSKVNLNPRLPPPIVSRESRRFMNRVGKVKEWRVVSQDNSNKGSLFVPRSTLSTHKEEPEDDKSPTLDSSSADEAQMNLGDFVPVSVPHRQNLCCPLSIFLVDCLLKRTGPSRGVCPLYLLEPRNHN